MDALEAARELYDRAQEAYGEQHSTQDAQLRLTFATVAALISIAEDAQRITAILATAVNTRL